MESQEIERQEIKRQEVRGDKSRLLNLRKQTNGSQERQFQTTKPHITKGVRGDKCRDVKIMDSNPGSFFNGYLLPNSPDPFHEARTTPL